MSPVFSLPRSLAILGVGLLIAILLVAQLVQPIRRQLAERHLARGDAYLAEQDVDRAHEEYTRALRENPQLHLAAEHLQLAEKLHTDIAADRNFFADHGKTEVAAEIDRVTRHFTDVKEAVTLGATLVAQGKQVYARYPLEQAVQLDPGYPDGWHYLAKAYDELAHYDPSFTEKAANARTQRDELTPKYLGQ